MLTIARIVDNDSVGTKVQLSDGSFSNVAHGGPAPSIGQAVEPKDFGYCIPVEGTRPHQTVDLNKVELDPDVLPDDPRIHAEIAQVNQRQTVYMNQAHDGEAIPYITDLPPQIGEVIDRTPQGELNAVDASGSNAKDEGGDNPDKETNVE